WRSRLNTPHRSLHSLRANQDLLPFPTRRSSDLLPEPCRRGPARPLREEVLGCHAEVVVRVEEAAAARDDAMPIGVRVVSEGHVVDRKSTRLNSIHVKISSAVFCLKTENKVTD